MVHVRLYTYIKARLTSRLPQFIPSSSVRYYQFQEHCLAADTNFLRSLLSEGSNRRESYGFTKRFVHQMDYPVSLRHSILLPLYSSRLVSVHCKLSLSISAHIHPQSPSRKRISKPAISQASVRGTENMPIRLLRSRLGSVPTL